MHCQNPVSLQPGCLNLLKLCLLRCRLKADDIVKVTPAKRENTHDGDLYSQMFSVWLVEKHFKMLHLSMIKLHETNHLNSTGLLQAVTVTPAVSFSQHKHWLRLWIGTSPCCCRHNGLRLFSLPLRFLLLLLQVFACHAKIQHNDSCHLQAQWGPGCLGKSAVERREQTLLFRIAHLFSHLKDVSALN